MLKDLHTSGVFLACFSLPLFYFSHSLFVFFLSLGHSRCYWHVNNQPPFNSILCFFVSFFLSTYCIGYLNCCSHYQPSITFSCGYFLFLNGKTSHIVRWTSMINTEFLNHDWSKFWVVKWFLFKIISASYVPCWPLLLLLPLSLLSYYLFTQLL